MGRNSADRPGGFQGIVAPTRMVFRGTFTSLFIHRFLALLTSLLVDIAEVCKITHLSDADDLAYVIRWTHRGWTHRVTSGGT